MRFESSCCLQKTGIKSGGEWHASAYARNGTDMPGSGRDASIKEKFKSVFKFEALIGVRTNGGF
jgi:hypothetical protein